MTAMYAVLLLWAGAAMGALGMSLAIMGRVDNRGSCSRAEEMPDNEERRNSYSEYREPLDI